MENEFKPIINIKELSSPIEFFALDFIEEVIMTDAIMMDGKALNLVYLDGKTIEIDDFMEILATNNIRRFLDIYHEDEDGNNVINVKNAIKMMCLTSGFKFNNAIVMKVFRLCQKYMAQLFISPCPQEGVATLPTHDEMMKDFDNLAPINQNYVKLCIATDVMPDEGCIYYDDETKAENEENIQANNQNDPDWNNKPTMCLNEMQMQVFFTRVYDGRLVPDKKVK